MTVREYIGARYVPLFMGNWDVSKAYEPLSIVIYQGNSYTSRQAVPAGVQISNENYWALSGNYNAQVEAYRQEVARFNDRITINADNISSLKNYTESVVNRNFILLGDSFGGGIYPNGSSYEYDSNGWVTYCSQLLRSFGCTVYTNPTQIITGNSGFTSTARFIDMINALYENSISKPEEITDIVVLAGTNDISSTANAIFSAVQTFTKRCKELFPQATVTIGAIGTDLVNLNGKIDSAYKGCQKYGGRYINTKNLFCYSQYVSSDGVHLTQAGYAFYINYFVDAVIYGNANYKFAFNVDIASNDDFNVSNARLNIVVTPNNVYINIRERSAGAPRALIEKKSNSDINFEDALDLVFDLPNMPLLPQYDGLITELTYKANVTFGDKLVEHFNIASATCWVSSTDKKLHVHKNLTGSIVGSDRALLLFTPNSVVM